MMRRILIGLALAFLASSAAAQVSAPPGVQQHGAVTPGNCMEWFGTNQAEDAGSPCGSGGGPSPANPTATAGPAAVDGSAPTFMRSDSAPAIQLGTNGQKGLLQCDGTSTSCSGGIVSAASGTVQSCGVIAPGTVATCTVRLNNAQLSALLGSPVPVIAAQGANTLVQVIESYYVYTVGSQTFTAGGPAGLYYAGNACSYSADGGDSSIPLSNNATLATADNAANETAISFIVNQGVVYIGCVLNYSGGTGNSMVLTVTWTSIPTQ